MKKLAKALKTKGYNNLVEKVQKADYNDSLERIRKAGSAPLIKLLRQLHRDITDFKEVTFPDFCKTLYELTRTLPVFRHSLQSYKKNVNQAAQIAEKSLEDAVKALDILEHNLALEMSDQLSNKGEDQEIFTYKI